MLVIEANAAVRELVQIALEAEGGLVVPTSSLAAALEVLRTFPIDCILTDLFRVQGQGPLQSLQPLLAEATAIPVGVLTGWSVSVEAVAQAGIAFILEKPFDLDELVSQVARALVPTPVRQPLQKADEETNQPQ